MLDWSISKYVISGLGVALLVSNTGWYIAWDHQRDKVVSEQIAHEKTKTEYKKAQLEAELIETKKARQKENEYAKTSQQAAANYAALLSKYNASLVRYQASQREANTIYMSDTTKTSDGTYDISTDTRILITLSDADICAENTAKSQAWLAWAKESGLVDEK